MKSHFLCAVCASLFSIISMSSHAALVDNGGGLIYDTVLDITWAQPDAVRSWDNANTWAAGLTLGGVSGWRLPYISVAAGAGPVFVERGHLHASGVRQLRADRRSGCGAAPQRGAG